MLQCWRRTGHLPSFFVPTRGIWQLKSPHPREFTIQGKKKKKCGGNFVNIISPCSVLEQRVFRNSAKIEVPGLLDKVLYEEAPPRGPAPYPFNIPFLTEKVPLRIPSVGNGTPFTCLVCIPLNCCKCTVFKIWINHKTRPFTQLFSQPCNASVSPFWAFLPTEMTVSATLSYT